jgi:hypothetical protein
MICIVASRTTGLIRQFLPMTVQELHPAVQPEWTEADSLE